MRPRMQAVALRLVRRPEIAEEVVQSAFEKALRHHEQFDERARFSTWLHRIVVNEALMWLRSEKRRARPGLADEATALDHAALRTPAIAEQRLIEHERRAALLTGLAQLPPIERRVIQRVALDGLSYEEFERESGVPPPAAKSRAFRGRKRLARWLESAV